MSEERPAGQDAPPARPSLADVASWLQGPSQPAPVADADADAAEDVATARAGAQGEVPAPEKVTGPPEGAVAEGDGEPDLTEQSGSPPADETATSGHVAATAIDEASDTGRGALPDEEGSPHEDEAPPVGDEGGTEADDHGVWAEPAAEQSDDTPGPSTTARTGTSDDTSPAWSVQPTGAEGTATASAAEPSPEDRSGPRGDREPGVEGADLLSPGSAVAASHAGAVSPQETPTDPRSWADDGDAAGADGLSPTEVPSTDPVSAFLPPAHAEAASADPPATDLEETDPVEEPQPVELPAEELPADEPQAEELPADEPQMDEPQADEPQADEPQAEVLQADEAQAGPEAGGGQGEADGAAPPASVTDDVDSGDDDGADGPGSSVTSGGPIVAALPDEAADEPDATAAGSAPAPALPTAIWSPEPGPDTTDDRGSSALAEAPTSTDEGGGDGSPDPGAAPGEATAAGAVAHGWAASEEQADDHGSAALFDLDLAKLAERARASALREAAPAPPRSFEPPPEPDPVAAPDILESFPPQVPFLAAGLLGAPSPFPDLVPAPATSRPTPDPDPASARPPEPVPEPVRAPGHDEPDRPVTPEPAAGMADEPTRAFDLSWDEESDDKPEMTESAAARRAQATVEAPVRVTAAHARQRPRYPRGQLREPIGVLRRIRAMLGILVVTVLLGVAAGTAVGAFIFFLAFAVRNAITSQ